MTQIKTRRRMILELLLIEAGGPNYFRGLRGVSLVSLWCLAAGVAIQRPTPRNVGPIWQPIGLQKQNAGRSVWDQKLEPHAGTTSERPASEQGRPETTPPANCTSIASAATSWFLTS
jgi:hypothetical protein